MSPASPPSPSRPRTPLLLRAALWRLGWALLAALALAAAGLWALRGGGGL